MADNFEAAPFKAQSSKFKAQEKIQIPSPNCRPALRMPLELAMGASFEL
jgi:hypothetical protein